jgi:putative heme transporter
MVKPSESPPSAAMSAFVSSIVFASIAFGCFVIVKALSVVMVFFAAIIIGEALRPFVDRLAKHLNRSLAIALTLLALGSAGAGTFALLIVTLRMQLTAFLELLSRNALEIAAMIQSWMGTGVRDTFVRFIAGNAGPIGLGFVEAQKSIASAVSIVLLVILMTAFWLASSDALCASILAFVPPKRRSAVHNLFDDMGGTLGLYAGGVVVNGTIVGLGSTTVLWFLHAPYPVILGLLQGLLVAVPYLGTLVAVVTAGGIVLAAQGWQRAAEAIALLSLMEGFEGSFISPLIFRKRLNLNPLTTVLATATGGALLGVTGVVFAVPAAALAQTVLERALEPALRKTWGPPDSQETTAREKPVTHLPPMLSNPE